MELVDIAKKNAYPQINSCDTYSDQAFYYIFLGGSYIEEIVKTGVFDEKAEKMIKTIVEMDK